MSSGFTVWGEDEFEAGISQLADQNEEGNFFAACVS
jgi:hypothetical protein